jgi:hypothetical protein
MKSIFSLLTLLLLLAATTPTFAIPAIHNSTTADVSPSLREQVRKLLKDYVEVKNALYGEEQKAARLHSGQMLKTLRTFNPTILESDEKAFYEAQTNALVNAIVKMSNEEDLAEQREYFKSVSASMVELVKGNNFAQNAGKAQETPTTNGADAATSAARITSENAPMLHDGEHKLCLRYCPIAKAYWISEADPANKEMDNPYIGRNIMRKFKSEH